VYLDGRRVRPVGADGGVSALTRTIELARPGVLSLWHPRPPDGTMRVSMGSPIRGEAETYIEASPERVYSLISDVTRMGKWSPETYWCTWVDGATGPAVGARFRARNRHGLLRWSNTPEVIAAEPGREFAFRRVVLGNEVRWRYRMWPAGSGTRLSESYDVLTPSPGWLNRLVGVLMGVGDREADLMVGMRTTLDRLRRAAERAERDQES
jgi:Polyketide cyclase / dehydrase and lipid transport